MIAGPTVVYSLCLVTSVACAGLLVRSYLHSRARLLMWSALCFVLLAFNNLFLVLDMVVFREIDFTWPRHLAALAAVSVLLFGFIWETDR